jgi:hypothetical protein
LFFHGQSQGVKAKTLMIEPIRIPVSKESPVESHPNALVAPAKTPVSNDEKVAPPKVIPVNLNIKLNRGWPPFFLFLLFSIISAVTEIQTTPFFF